MQQLTTIDISHIMIQSDSFCALHNNKKKQIFSIIAYQYLHPHKDASRRHNAFDLVNSILWLLLLLVVVVLVPYWPRVWAACVIFFFACLRKSKFLKNTDNHHYINRDQVVINTSEQVMFVINSRKVIQFKQRCVCIPLPEISNHPLCPIKLLKWMFLHSSAQQDSDPVFTFTPDCWVLNYLLQVSLLKTSNGY